MNSRDINHIKDYRKLLIETLGKKCSKCSSTKNLIIHHKTYQKDVQLKDVELLCNSCHGLTMIRRIIRKGNPFKILECKKCKHKWVSRIAGEPIKCPNCQTKEWKEPGTQVEVKEK
jgi:hypothetical protein